MKVRKMKLSDLWDVVEVTKEAGLRIDDTRFVDPRSAFITWMKILERNDFAFVVEDKGNIIAAMGIMVYPFAWDYNYKQAYVAFWNARKTISGFRGAKALQKLLVLALVWAHENNLTLILGSIESCMLKLIKSYGMGYYEHIHTSGRSPL